MKAHLFVRDSPNYKDTLKINGQYTGKLIRLCSVRELHNDIIEKGPEMKDVTGKCMMQECTSCPTYQIHPIEFQNDEDSNKIKFQA